MVEYGIASPKHIMVLLYGEPGIGKTTFGVSAPNPVLLDLEQGAYRAHARDIAHIPTLQISTYEELIEVLDKKDLKAFDTVVIDTVGELIEFITDFIGRDNPRLKGKAADLSLQGFGERKRRFKQFFQKLRKLRKHVVLIAHDKEIRVEDKITIRPEGGTLIDEAMKDIDLAGRMYATTEGRVISFAPTSAYTTKSFPGLAKEIEVYDTADGNTGLQELITKWHEFHKEREDGFAKYNKLLKEWTPKLNAITGGADEINKTTEDLKAVEHIYDSKIKLWQVLSDRAASLGLKRDKDKGWV